MLGSQPFFVGEEIKGENTMSKPAVLDAPAAPAADKPISTPTDNQTGADAKPVGSLIDVKPDADANGKDPKAVDPASSKDTPPKADATTPDPKPEDKATVVPEKYEDPKLPEGMALVPELKTKFDALAKDLKLSQEQYQKVIDIQTEYAKAEGKSKIDDFNQTISDWKSETTKELGADTARSLAAASKGIDTVFTDAAENKQFREMLSDKATGLGNWRLMVKFCSFLGKKVSEDGFVDGKSHNGSQKSDAEVIFNHPSSVALRSGK